MGDLYVYACMLCMAMGMGLWMLGRLCIACKWPGNWVVLLSSCMSIHHLRCTMGDVYVHACHVCMLGMYAVLVGCACMSYMYMCI